MQQSPASTNVRDKTVGRAFEGARGVLHWRVW